MATLYDITNVVRKVVIGFLVFALVVVFFSFVGQVTEQAQIPAVGSSRFFMDPDISFGNIPAPKIKGINVSGNPSFSIKGVHLKENFPDVSYVYKIDLPREKLFVFEKALNVVNLLGFDPEIYKELSENKFEWSIDGGTKTIIFDKILQSWELRTNYLESFEALQRRTLLSDINSYTNPSRSLLRQLGFDTFGMNDPKISARYMQLGADGLFRFTLDPVDNGYVLINIYRNLPLADLKPQSEQPKVLDKTFVPKPFTGIVYKNDPLKGSFRVVASRNLGNIKKDVFELDFINYFYSPTKASYFIVTPDEAWNNIQRGFGSLVSIVAQGGNELQKISEIDVRSFSADASRTEIGFFEPDEWDGYVYPIYIFRGVATLSDGRLSNFEYFIDAIKRIE